jgi:hypothetical protein
MIIYWLAETFGLHTKDGELDYSAVIDLPVSDLHDFMDYMAPAMSRSGTPDVIFSPAQKQILNLWNRLVPANRDKELLTRFTKSWDYLWCKTDVPISTVEAYIKSLMDESASKEPDPFTVVEPKGATDLMA